MIAILVCISQLTALCLLTLAAAKLCLLRAPQLAAQLSFWGILLSGATVVVACLDLPRPWTLIRSTSTSAQMTLTSSNPPTETKHDPDMPSLAWGIPLESVLAELSKLRQSQPVLESRVVKACYVFAFVIGLLFLLRCLVGGWTLVRLWSTCSRNTELELNQQLANILQRNGFWKTPKIYTSTRIHTPCVSWLRRGVIYVPEGFSDWSDVEQQTALAHEWGHEIRWDAQWRFVAELLLSLFYFHPLAGRMRRTLILGQELATDRRAAQMLGSLKRYRQGLSMLALRMDADRKTSFSFGVSVSTNSVVRRIRMLHLKEPKRRPWQEIIVTIVFSLMTTLSIGWTIQADEPLRLASRNKVKPPVASVFQHAPLEPWNELGQQTGYVTARPSQLNDFPEYQRLADFLISHLGEKTGIDFDGYGVKTSNMEILLTNLSGSVTRVPEEKQLEEGKQYTGNLTATAIDMKTHSPVRWSELTKEVVQKVIPLALEQPKAVKSLAELGTSNHLCMVSKDSEPVDDMSHRLLQQTYSQVSGGLLTGAFIVPHDDLLDAQQSLSQDKDPFGLLPVLTSTRTLGAGVDLNSADQQHWKLVLLPGDTVSATLLLESVKDVQSRMITIGSAMRLLAPNSDKRSKSGLFAQLAQDVAKADIRVGSLDSGHMAVFIELKVNIDIPTIFLHRADEESAATAEDVSSTDAAAFSYYLAASR